MDFTSQSLRASEQHSTSLASDAVNLTIRTIDYNLGACHCDMCRRWGGGH